MKNRTQIKEPRTFRRTAAAVAVALAVAGGIVAGAASAAPAAKVGKHSHSQKKTERIREPRIENGVLTVEGTNAGDRIAVRLQAQQPGIIEVDLGDDGSADFSFDRARVAMIAVDAGNGDDFVRIDESNGVFGDTIRTTLEGGNGGDSLAGGTGAGTLLGGNGDDRLSGGSGAESLLGGNGDDSIDGNRGSDVALMGNGDDTFVWDPGDGSDIVEGQKGDDTMVFNGAGVAERVDLTANGRRLRFFRDPATITMDTDGVERVDFTALGGADVVSVDDLSATDVTSVNIDLGGALGGSVGDGQPDRVIVNATNGNDTIDVSGDAAAVTVSGLAPTIRVLHAEVANDKLEINTLAGTDTVDSAGLAAGAIQLLVDGALT